IFEAAECELRVSGKDREWPAIERPTLQLSHRAVASRFGTSEQEDPTRSLDGIGQRRVVRRIGGEREIDVDKDVLGATFGKFVDQQRILPPWPRPISNLMQRFVIDQN